MRFLFISIFTVSLTLIGCNFQPNNANGIVILKVADDTLSLSIIDSYHIIKKYTSKIENDTLYINVDAIHSPTSSEWEEGIAIAMEPQIKVVKLQNDRVFNRDSIPWFGKWRILHDSATVSP